MLTNSYEKEVYLHIKHRIDSSASNRLVFTRVPQNVICELRSDGYIVNLFTAGGFDSVTEVKLASSIEVLKVIKS